METAQLDSSSSKAPTCYVTTSSSASPGPESTIGKEKGRRHTSTSSSPSHPFIKSPPLTGSLKNPSKPSLFSFSRGFTHQSMKGGSAAAASSLARRFIWVVKAPLRALCRARDLYVSTMTGCAGRFTYSGAVGYPVGAAAPGVPRSYSFQGWSSGSSTSGGEDDLRELIRVASRGATGSLNLGRSPGEGPAVARSRSVGMGRIDEDKPCDFGEVSMAPMLYPRSRSCAVPKRMMVVKA